MARLLLSRGHTFDIYMIDIPFSQSNYVTAGQEPAALQQYVHALLTRQHSLDLLETIHQQINQVWATILKLLEGTGAAHRASQAVRAARAARAVQAKNAYRSLEKRREECIAILHQAELRKNAAWQTILAAGPQARPGKTSGLQSTARAASDNRLISRPARQKVKNACSARC